MKRNSRSSWSLKKNPKLQFLLAVLITAVIAVPLLYLPSKRKNIDTTSSADAAAEQAQSMKQFTPDMFMQFPDTWVHKSYEIGMLNGKQTYRQAFATGLSPFYATDGVSPTSAVYSRRFQRTYIVYPAGTKRATQTAFGNFYRDEVSAVDPYMLVYDHLTKQISGPFKLANVSKKNDQHNYPIVIEDRAGYVHVFYSYHGDTGSTTGNYRDITHMVSEKAGDVTSWKMSSIPNTSNHTYLQVVKDYTGRINAFYRKTGADVADKKDHYGQTTYVYSSDNGITWSEPRSIVSPPRSTEGQNGPKGWNMIYMRTAQLDPKKNRIWITFRESQWYNEAVNRYFLAYLDTQDGTMYTIGGKNLGTEIGWQELEDTETLKELEFFSYGGSHQQDKKFAQGKDMLLFKDIESVPELMITRYFSPAGPVGLDTYYENGYYQPNHIRFEAGTGWKNLGVPEIFSAQQIMTDTSVFYQGSNYIFFKNPGPTSQRSLQDVDSNSFIAKVTSLDPLRIEKVRLFGEDQKDWQSTGTTYFSFIPTNSDMLMGVAIVPKYSWWLNAKNRAELANLSNAQYGWYGFPPIGAGYLVTQEKAQDRVDTKTESKAEQEKFCALTSVKTLPQCVSWNTITINGCTQQDWQANNSICRSTSAEGYAWLHIKNNQASHVRFINVAVGVNCAQVAETDPTWSPWEEIIYFKHWQLGKNAGAKKVCAQFTTRCSQNNTEVKSPICGAVTN